MTVLLSADAGLRPDMRARIGFANTLATWTLYPLLERDELRIPYFVLTGLWAYLMGLPPVSLSAHFGEQGGHLSWPVKLVHLLFYIGMVAWHVGEAYVLPPPGMPDLWVVGNVCLGAAGFGLCYLWCLWQLTLKSGLFKVAVKKVEEVKKTQ